jgi:hypothetical protein
MKRWVDLRYQGKKVGQAEIEFEEGKSVYRISKAVINDPESHKELFDIDYSQFSLSTKETFSLNKEET